jgi:hypothetical protein
MEWVEIPDTSSSFFSFYARSAKRGPKKTRVSAKRYPEMTEVAWPMEKTPKNFTPKYEGQEKP